MKTQRPFISDNFIGDGAGWLQDSLSRRVDTVGQVVAGRPYLTFQITDPIERIVRGMQRRHQGAVCVADAGGRLVGFLTERDILRKIFGRYGESQKDYDERHEKLSIYPESLSAWDVMVPSPVCLYEDVPVEEALSRIQRHGFRFMPVLAEHGQGRAAGIVSERELFWHTLEKQRRMMERKDTLLSYFMHHEPYGIGSAATETTH